MDVRSALERALEHYRAGRLIEVESACQEILEAEPNQADALRFLGLLAYHAGSPEQAIELMNRAIQANPTNASFHANLGNFHAVLGHLDEAIATYRKALEINPEFAEVQCDLGNAFQAQGKFDQALTCFQRALDLKPGFAQAHYNQGNALSETGNLDAAIAAYGRACEINPNFADAQYNLGNALTRLGDLPSAAAAYRRAGEIAPNLAHAHYNLGNTLYELGRLEEAKRSYQRALKIDSSLVMAHVNLGNVAKLQDRLADAVACHRRALAIDPNFAEAHSSLGHILLLAGQGEEAVAACRRAVEINPDLAVGHMSLSASLTAINHLAEASAAARRAIQVSRVFPRPCTGKAIGRVVVLKGLENGHFTAGSVRNMELNVGLNNADKHLDRARFWQCDLFVDDLGPSQLLDVLPPCDVIFNVISDVDSMPRCHAAAKAFARQVSVPVINHPDIVDGTQRHANYELLHELDGIVFPKTLNLSSPESQGETAFMRMAEAEITFPVLVRRAGTHTGESLEKADSRAELEKYLATESNVGLYISEFLNFSRDNGKFTKMRAFIVDGGVYPAHLFISDDWYVRGHDEARRLMRENQWMTDEKTRFLSDPQGYLGASAYDCLASIPEAIPLDYFGIDFAQLPDGRILIFEANAVMNHHYEFIGDFPFQKAPLDAITDALQRLVVSRIEGSRKATRSDPR